MGRNQILSKLHLTQQFRALLMKRRMAPTKVGAIRVRQKLDRANVLCLRTLGALGDVVLDSLVLIEGTVAI